MSELPDIGAIRAVDTRGEIAAVPERGYRWWYVDGLSDDGRRGFTAIYMYGSVFSPWRAQALRRGEPALASAHLGMHVALYEDQREVAWTMSEYGTSGLEATAAQVRLGGSSLSTQPDGAVRGEIAERTAPIFWSRAFGMGSALTGRFSLTSSGVGAAAPVEIGRSPTGDVHLWQVRIPTGRIEVDFDHPGFRFSGRGYHDTNWGQGQLEEAFRRWSWARFHSPQRSRILYGVEGRDGSTRGYVVDAAVGRETEARADLAVHFAQEEATGWGLSAPRGFTIEDASAGNAEVVRWLDRTPFYARYVARLGEVEGVGEYLDLDRFQQPFVQFLLRWRGHRYPG